MEYAKTKIGDLAGAVRDFDFELSHTSGNQQEDEDTRCLAERRVEAHREIAVRVLRALDERGLALKIEAAGGVRTLGVLVETAMKVLDEHKAFQEALGTSGPTLEATSLHPMVWGAAGSLWGTQHRREAVEAAANGVNAMLQQKLGTRQVSTAKLANEAFGKNAPSEDHPRLRFPGTSQDVDRDTWISRHEGARSFAVGCFMALRNPATHGDDEISEQVGLEQLAAFSILARWVDESERVTADPTADDSA